MTELVLNIAVAAVVVGLGVRPTYVLLRDVTWPWQARAVRAWSAEVDAAFAARQLESPAPLHVVAERVGELEAPRPVLAYVVDPERERQPIDLDALEA